MMAHTLSGNRIKAIVQRFLRYQCHRAQGPLRAIHPQSPRLSNPIAKLLPKMFLCPAVEFYGAFFHAHRMG
ncbi:hypothetical protein EVA_16512 [gut metagenome]|uniref:Uncharacterized protein n=1 Tax=gut metagenome TaxID=749906 RepID=J9G0P7_9ZZZZ